MTSATIPKNKVELTLKPYRFERQGLFYYWWCPYCRKHVKAGARTKLSACKCGKAFFDKQKADTVVDFFRHLTLTEGEWNGLPFKLLPWQENEIIRPIFGTVDANGFRIYRKAYCELPKKSGKSPLAAGLALWMTGLDNEPAAQVYGAATNRNQAGYVFSHAERMVNADPELLKHFRVLESTKRILCGTSKYVVVSSDTYSQSGQNTHCLIFDELHELRDRKYWRALTFGSMSSRRQPLLFIITTAGDDLKSICHGEHEYALKVRDGIIPDPKLLPIIYAADPKADIHDPKTWYAANPSLGVTVKVEDVKAEADEVQKKPQEENTFRRLRLNQWVQVEGRWLEIQYWDACAGDPIDESILYGRPCYGGLDLSSNLDLTAYVLVFPADQEETFYIALPRFFMPADNVKERSEHDRVPYDLWVQQGHIITTPGNVTSHAAVVESLAADAHKFDIIELAFDQWGSPGVIQRLQEIGFDDENKKLIKFPQVLQHFTGPTKELQNLTISRRIWHGGHPVLRFCSDCMTLYSDVNNNVRPVKPDRDKSTKRIDGMVAFIMGLSRALGYNPEAQKSVYETRGIVTIGG